MADKMRTFLFLAAIGAVGYSMYYDGIGFGNVAVGVLVIVCLILNLRARGKLAREKAEAEAAREAKIAEREARKARRVSRHGTSKKKEK